MDGLHPNDRIKYPRTPHLPESLGATSDDKWISAAGLSYLSSGIDLVVTEKMDGGNLTMSRTHFHGRSIDSGTHAWDTRARALWAEKRFDIPEGWRISGESMYARRSVAYDDLPGVYLVFGIWDETNTLLDWDSTVEWSQMLELPMVPTLYRGTSLDEARTVWKNSGLTEEMSEGFVIRDAGRVSYKDFDTKVAKFVRDNHIRTSANWRHRDDFDVNGFVS